jgi:hypothetical protein
MASDLPGKFKPIGLMPEWAFESSETEFSDPNSIFQSPKTKNPAYGRVLDVFR